MPICPSCRSEYEAGTTKCADCDVLLVDRLVDAASAADMVDVYACYEVQQAERLSEILGDESVDVLVRDRSSNLFPTSVGKSAQRTIAVPTELAGRARELITAAIKDGVVPDDGELIGS